MSRPLQTQIFRTGEHLAPSKLNAAEQAVMKDLEETVSRRYTHSPVVFPFGALDEASGAGEREMKFKPPWDMTIEYAELILYGDDNNAGVAAVTLTMTATGITGWEDLEIVVPAGGSTTEESERYASSNAMMSVAANQDVVMSLDSPAATWRTTRADLVLHVRFDRHLAAPPVGARLTRWKTEAPDATQVSGFSTLLTADVDDDATAANKTHGRMEVIAKQNPTIVTANQERRIPSSARYFEAANFYVVAHASRTVEIDINDELAVTQGTSGVLTGAGTGSTVEPATNPVDIKASQAVDDPTDEADDWIALFTPGGSNSVYRAYAVLYSSSA